MVCRPAPGWRSADANHGPLRSRRRSACGGGGRQGSRHPVLGEGHPNGEPDSMTAPPYAAPSSGWLEGREHVLPVRIYYEDTDFTGMVYHANYLRYFERGRSDFFRLAGISHTNVLQMAEQTAFTLVRIDLDYKCDASVEEEL